jgi:hypothetical protein
LFNFFRDTDPQKYDAQIKQIELPDEIKASFKNSGMLRLIPYYWVKNNKLLELRFYIIDAYYEFLDNQWIFKEGNKNAENGINFNDHLEYNCETATWSEYFIYPKRK